MSVDRGNSHGLRKCFHRTSLNNREEHNDDKMGRKRDEKSRLYRFLFDPLYNQGGRHSGRSSLSGGGVIIDIWRWVFKNSAHS